MSYAKVATLEAARQACRKLRSLHALAFPTVATFLATFAIFSALPILFRAVPRTTSDSIGMALLGLIGFWSVGLGLLGYQSQTVAQSALLSLKNSDIETLKSDPQLGKVVRMVVQARGFDKLHEQKHREDSAAVVDGQV